MDSGKSETKILFLKSGDTLSCDYEVVGYLAESSIVVGYFNEKIDDITIALREEGDHLYVVITELKEDGNKDLEKISLIKSH